MYKTSNCIENIKKQAKNTLQDMNLVEMRMGMSDMDEGIYLLEILSLIMY